MSTITNTETGKQDTHELFERQTSILIIVAAFLTAQDFARMEEKHDLACNLGDQMTSLLKEADCLNEELFDRYLAGNKTVERKHQGVDFKNLPANKAA